MDGNTLTLIIGFLILFIFVGALLALLFTGWNDEGVRAFVMRHFVVIVCFPAAGLFAFLVVAIFQVAAGEVGKPLELKIAGIVFTGSGGPITLWILAYLAIAITVGKFFEP